MRIAGSTAQASASATAEANTFGGSTSLVNADATSVAGEARAGISTKLSSRISGYNELCGCKKISKAYFR